MQTAGNYVTKRKFSVRAAGDVIEMTSTSKTVSNTEASFIQIVSRKKISKTQLGAEGGVKDGPVCMWM